MKSSIGKTAKTTSIAQMYLMFKKYIDTCHHFKIISMELKLADRKSTRHNRIPLDYYPTTQLIK